MLDVCLTSVYNNLHLVICEMLHIWLSISIAQAIAHCQSDALMMHSACAVYKAKIYWYPMFLLIVLGNFRN